jgi:SAM-dependent methyltransferase
MDGQLVALADGVFDAILLNLVLAVVPDPIACAREVVRLLRPHGRVAIFDKWLPEGAQPSPLRRALNVVTSAAFSDINRQLWPILEGTGLQLVHDEPAGPWGLYKVSLALR